MKKKNVAIIWLEEHNMKITYQHLSTKLEGGGCFIEEYPSIIHQINNAKIIQAIYTYVLNMAAHV